VHEKSFEWKTDRTHNKKMRVKPCFLVEGKSRKKFLCGLDKVFTQSDNANAVGDLNGLVVRGEAHISLLQSVGADQSVDLQKRVLK